MRDTAESAARAALADAVSLWRITPAASDVIDAATDALVAGLDSPSLRILAGESPTLSAYELGPLIEDTMRELDLAEVLEGDAQRPALAAMLRRLRAGRIGPRELTAWAHAHIGHDGDADCSPFVLLDDVYDDREDAGQDLSVVDRWTYEEADAFLDGRPSPGLTERWVPPMPPARPSPPPQPLSHRARLARLLARLRR